MGIETQTVPFSGRMFPHERHVIDAGIDCATCHQAGTPETAPGHAGHGDLSFGSEGCASCHHADASADCAACHAAIRKGKVASSLGDFDHAFHLDEAGADCATCHQAAPGGAFTLNGDACSTCH